MLLGICASVIQQYSVEAFFVLKASTNRASSYISRGEQYNIYTFIHTQPTIIVYIDYTLATLYLYTQADEKVGNL